MKPIYNLKRTPKKGDWIKMEGWDKFFEVASVDSRIRFKGFETSDHDYGLEWEWIWRE